ncbi:hypothetical protein CHS0354_039423 [Potamilus streckersoni]|uniref:Methyltransferase domain-containing protein n=1 Tax=Potamilus streckersoni TaxID=2493646 RepID=A0AAE0S1J2_9BIVA|nr:hypothetical protein CHS0354_039423 [Potamilus streckersoni]
MADIAYQNYVSNASREDAEAYHSNFQAFKGGLTPQQIADYYSQWGASGKYDIHLGSSRYLGPMQAARAIGEYFVSDRENVRILDVAAGTGKVGQELYNLGFRNMDALDPSEGMLNKAKEKGVYNQIFNCCFELNMPIPDDSYDCLVVVGGMGEGHLPAESVYEMIRLVKPGGLICIAMREEYLQYVEAYKDKLQPLMERLEREGKWYQYKKEHVPNYAFGKDGTVFQYVVHVSDLAT